MSKQESTLKLMSFFVLLRVIIEFQCQGRKFNQTFKLISDVSQETAYSLNFDKLLSTRYSFNKEDISYCKRYKVAAIAWQYIDSECVCVCFFL
jgi:hypothetical protein